MEEVDDFSIWNINSVLTHIKDNMVSFILLICVFFIIYLVDHLTNYNTTLMAAAAAMPMQVIQPIIKKRKGVRFNQR
jgi:uncharacterized membrane protein YozB (DUF420 family)